MVALVHQREQREQHHLHLLGRGQPGRVVECHGAAVGHQTVDELQPGHIGGDGRVPVFERGLVCRRQGRQLLVDHIVLVQGNGAQPPARGAEVLGERIHQDGVHRAHREQRTEVVGEGAVDIVRQDHQVGPVVLDDLGNLFQAVVVELHGWRVGGVDTEEDLDRRVLELVQLGVRILPAGLRIGVDRHGFQPVGFQLRNLDVGGEHRHADGHLVALAHQLVLLERIEDVGHSGGAAFGGEDVHLLRGDAASHHLLHHVLAHDLLADAQHARRHGVIAAQHPFHHFVQEFRGGQPQLVSHIAQRAAQKGHAFLVLEFTEKALETAFDALDLRQPADAAVHIGKGQLRFRGRKQPQAEEGPARHGGQEVGVAAAGVQHVLGGSAGGQLDQLILEFERAQLGELAVISHLNLLRFKVEVRQRPRPKGPTASGTHSQAHR